MLHTNYPNRAASVFWGMVGSVDSDSKTLRAADSLSIDWRLATVVHVRRQ
jgi:hypothetical protein